MELHRGDSYLTLSQISSALAYYYDHKDELDALIARRQHGAEELRKTFDESPAAARLRQLKQERRQGGV